MAPKSSREQALAALSLMRREKLSLNAAAQRLDISPDVVRRYAGEGLRRGASGNFYAKPSDDISRSMNFLTGRGLIEIEVRNSKDATLISRYMTALKDYLATGEKSFLDRFRGRRVGTHRFITDPDILDELADAGEVDFDSLYRI